VSVISWKCWMFPNPRFHDTLPIFGMRESCRHDETESGCTTAFKCHRTRTAQPSCERQSSRSRLIRLFSVIFSDLKGRAVVRRV
jgi:hypothetical protein